MHNTLHTYAISYTIYSNNLHEVVDSIRMIDVWSLVLYAISERRPVVCDGHMTGDCDHLRSS